MWKELWLSRGTLISRQSELDEGQLTRERLNRVPKNSKQQIPRRLKPPRDDKNDGDAAAYLKVRPFKVAKELPDYFAGLVH
jgi:hypothetical protein